MGDRTEKITEKSVMPKGMIIALVLSFLAVAALVAAIVYLYMHRYTEDTSLPATDGTSEMQPGDDDRASEEVINAMDAVEEAAGTKEIRPEEWYGAYESSGAIETDADLDSYIAVCPDVYAFIEIPGCDIAYPIVYCEDAVDPFYFTHSIDGGESDKGSIITDSMNSRDFSDPVTLVYGQSPDDGSMFGGLHRLRDASVFGRCDRVNILMPDAQLTYRIYACYIGPADHILVGNDFNDPVSFMRFFDSIEDIRDLSMNIRQEAKPQLGDHVIMLVTHCGDEDKRLFVCAVLDEVRY